jgi:serine/threonine protein kinase
VKTSTRDDPLPEVLELFELEVRMAWMAAESARSGRSSHIVDTYGIAVSWESGPGVGDPQLHLVMERLSCEGDIHDEIDRTENWVLLRSNGVDTGASFRNQLVMRTRLDVWAYAMAKQLKLKISIELTKALIELKAANIVHCDIKPANTVLHTPEDHGWPTLKLIDFGEANTLTDALGDIAGTPGYMAPEMESGGEASCGSDMFSAGMCGARFFFIVPGLPRVAGLALLFLFEEATDQEMCTCHKCCLACSS